MGKTKGNITATTIEKLMSDYNNKLTNRLQDGSITVTEISQMIGELMKNVQSEVMEETGCLLSSETKSNDNPECPKCGERLKKTKKPITR